MLFKCLLILLISVFIEGQYPSYHRSQPCPYPHLANGRVRVRQRTKLVKFMCLSRYELVGNRYATCRNGQWDVPVPVCVRAGCLERPAPPNSLQIKYHHDAYVITFCKPGYKMVGPAVTYCDGSAWNGTGPDCVDLNIPPELSCDFEKPDLCGWKQDELHDFDWIRLNKKTPSYFVKTGPTYDHTLGVGKAGYYMYIESSGKDQNNSARILSPIIDAHLVDRGCFSFYYHMYGSSVGGLRVYQKPDRMQLLDMLMLSKEEKTQYVLFEQWGNQGDVWYGTALPLRNFNDSFQIIIEGIRGSSYTSDIAIDDVAILQGENCTNFSYQATTPQNFPLDTCSGRCNNVSLHYDCDCTTTCIQEERCCSDYLDMCVFGNGTSSTESDETSPSDGQPQTEKLIGETTLTTLLAPTTSTPKPTTTKPSTTPITRLTTKPAAVTKPTTTKPTTTTTIKTKLPTTPKKVVTTTKKVVATTKLVPTPQETTTKRMLTTTKKVISNFTPNYRDEMSKSKKELLVQKYTFLDVQNPSPKERKSSAWKPVVITIAVLAVLAALTYLVIAVRGNRGRVTLARLRGRLANTHDSEVRYLNSTDDDL